MEEFIHIDLSRALTEWTNRSLLALEAQWIKIVDALIDM